MGCVNMVDKCMLDFSSAILLETEHQKLPARVVSCCGQIEKLKFLPTNI